MQDCFKRNIDYLRVSLTSNCNLRCQYCMPEQKIKQTEEMLSQKDLIHLVELISSTGIKKIRLTGGEPLLYPQIILELAKNLKPLSIPLFLETNGTLVKQLAQVIDEIDIISMDMKLPSDIGKAYWQEHEEFLKLASKKDVYIKIVVSSESTVEDFEKEIFWNDIAYKLK